jgi:hypothetical protein
MTDATPYTGSDWQFEGARLGMDFYAPNGAGAITIVAGHPNSSAEHMAGEVNWGTTTWTLRTWDITIPDTIYTQDINGNAIPPTPITYMVLWLEATPPTFQGIAWFADAYLYINPT